MNIKFIDLFAGIGGIKIAFENAGFQCVFSNDFDKNAKTTFDLNVDWPQLSKRTTSLIHFSSANFQ